MRYLFLRDVEAIGREIDYVKIKSANFHVYVCCVRRLTQTSFVKKKNRFSQSRLNIIRICVRVLRVFIYFLCSSLAVFFLTILNRERTRKCARMKRTKI